MRKILLLLLLCASPVWATTSVQGNLDNLGGGTVTGGAFVRFWLRGCGGNQPRINGTALIAPSNGGVFYFDMTADASGNISGTLYSTRDSTGVLAGDIECGGSKTSEWYGMQVFVNGKGGPEVPIHAKSGVTLDITQVTPITVTPVVTAPTGDSTYMRIDAGNSPATGAWTFNGAITAGAGGTLNGAFTYGGAGTHNGLETFAAGIVANDVKDSSLTTGNCVQAAASGQLTTVSGPCGTSSGTLTATGAPVSGNLAKFSGATSLTNGDLSGDCTTSGTLAITCQKINGNSVPSGAAADQLLVGTAASTLSLKTVADCQDASGKHLNYTQSTHAFSCGTTSSTATNWGRYTGTPCHTGVGPYTLCSTTVSLNASEPDTNYSVSCTGIGPTGYPALVGITSKGTTSVTVRIMNFTSFAAVDSYFSEIDCVVSGT